jgi:HEAT repeat protein
MGLFDFFKKSSSTAPPPGSPAQDKTVARLGRTAADKLAQNYDRLEALEALARIQSSEAAAALLKRFTFSIEPSITDQEEKELAFRGIVDCGELAHEPTMAFCEKAESLTWPLKILREILTPESYIDEVVGLLDEHDTEYARNVDPKLHLIEALMGQKGDEVREVLLRFLEDVSEPVRFKAVACLFSMDDESLTPRLTQFALDDESVRVRNEVAKGFAARNWAVPSELRDAFASSLYGSHYSVSQDGKIRA